MNEDFLAAFKKYNIHLAMSLPGLETFQKHTGVDNAQGVLYWFNRAKEEGIRTTGNITVTNLNYYELYEIIANALVAGAETILLNRFLVGGRGITYRKELSLNKTQLNDMLHTAEELLQKTKRIGSVGTEYPLCLIKDRDKLQRLNIGSVCSAAKDFFVIDPSGKVRACNHSPHVVGNIFDQDSITDKDYWQRFNTRDYLPQQCLRCKDVGQCDCGCRETAHIVYGDLCALDCCLQE